MTGPGPIIDTTGGPVRGVGLDGVNVFRGIPYAAPPTGARRFRPPQPAIPWSEVRPGHDYGPIAMQGEYPDPENLPFGSGFYDAGAPRSEDCLTLHVWAPVTPGPPRPVMVWIHGGAFGGGSGHGPWTDGERLAGDGDVVVVSVNHRLGGFGFLSLASFSPEYADSGNAGMLDLVAALAWVRDNIDRFGGDPGNVTVFGESGGGWKISALLAIESARGLFHKAIVQSGSYLRALEQDYADRVARQVLETLGIPDSDVGSIDDVPVGILRSALSVGFPPEGAARIFSDGTWTFNLDFAPVLDGRTLRQHPYHPEAPPASAGVPLLIGTTKDELGPEVVAGHYRHPERVLEAIAALGVPEARARTVVEFYRAQDPDISDTELLLRLNNDTEFGTSAVLQAERALAIGTESVYSYVFAWDWPAMSNRANHLAEIPFVFGTLDDDVAGEPVDAPTRRLAELVQASWVAFARTGNPGVPGLPAWEPYSVERRATMVFDRESRVVPDPRAGHPLRLS